MPNGSMQPHTLHPIVLDATNQIGVILFQKDISNSPAVPVHMSEIWISADITSKPGDELFVTVKQEPGSGRSAFGNIHVYQKCPEGNLKTVLGVCGGELRAIGEKHTRQKDVPFSTQSAFRMAWDTDAQFLTEEIFLNRIANIDMRTLLYTDSAKPVETSSMSFDEMAADFLILGEKLACIYLRDALHRIDAEKIEVITPHLLKLLTWIRKWCSSPEFHHFIAQVGDTGQEIALLSTAEDSGVEWKMLRRVGNALPEILSGRQDPLALMFEDNLWNAFYKSGLFKAHYIQLAEYIRVLAFKNPHMRILEIGAGTGSCTMPLLEALTLDDGVQFERYHYTDISPAFFPQARSDFSAWDEYIDYKVLDIDCDPIGQGFSVEGYDIVVCSSVLHATKVMDATMRNIRKLVKPGGKLVVIEITRFTAAYQTIFGCLPG
jgi:phospholipid N-methyltransferase